MKIFNQIYGSVATWLWATLVCMALAACEEDALVKGWPSPADGGKVTFTVTIPDYALPTRADAGDTFDPAVTSLHLYLFDNQGYFTGIVEAQSVADPAEKDKVLTDGTNTTATYNVSIPQNTDDVHFIANHPQPDNAWIEKNLGRTADAVIPPMVTDGKVYWGKSTFGELTENDGTTFSPTPVVLYRNYAMVTSTLNRSTNSHIVENGILGWTLCNVPSKGTVAPFDNAVIGSGAAGEPFHFNLTTGTAADRFATMPLEEADRTFADNPAGTSNTLGQPIAVFDHTIAGYGQKKMYAVFQIKTTSENTETTKFYKIALIDGNKEDYDIKRNHRYTINFKDINPALGYTTFDEAATDDALAANDNVVDIQETLPELQSSTATLSVVNGTVRYIDDLTTHAPTTDDAGTRYSVNDIYIYYTGNSNNLKVSWKESHWGNTGQYQPEIGSLTITPTTGTFNEKAYTHVISFDADEFALYDNGSNNHFKEGLIRVAETDGPLSRFVRVYIGEPISFRPLLISSDIPAMTDERLTVAFNVPDTTYLPRALYPIEIRFGSDRIDVEKNIFVESMKVEQPATERYSDVLEWKGSTDKYDWNWTATGTAENLWRYKYVYTLDSPEEAVRQHRITLRTVNNLSDDFSVLMEGLSTVLKDGAGEAEAKVFNTRELKFHMQQTEEGTPARRIMLDDGMYETRLVTAYKYAIADASGQTIVSIPYTLGTYNDETNTMTPATVTKASTLWVYYDPDVLAPCDENGKLAPTTPWWGKNTRTEDPEGNTYVTVDQTTATGTLYFQTVNKTAENSLVFITARSEAGYGTYNDAAAYNEETTGYPKDYINTGVNATAGSEYRSASAIINVKDKWQFNPAPSTTNGNFAHAEEFAMPYGCTNKFDAANVQTDDNLLYVRIERPAGTSGVKLEIETEGKLQLMDNDGYTVETFTYKDKENKEQIARYDGYANNIEIDDKKVTTIKLTLTDANTDYCVLLFRALKYNCACTITLKSAEGSAVPYETDYLKITNEPISVSHIAYMTRAEYEARRNSNYSVDDRYFTETSIKLSPVPHANYVVRAYLPKSATFATVDQPFIIYYKAFKSVVLPSLIFSTGETGTGTGFSDKYDKTTANDNNYALTYMGIKSTADFAYVDILLQSKDEEVAETPRIESDRAIGLYRYSLSGLDNADAIERDAYEMWFSEHANGIMTNATEAVGQEVFQTFSPGGKITGQTITALGKTFTQGAKFNSNGNMAIAVPKDNMFLTVVAAMKSGETSCAGFNVMTLGTDGKDSFTGEDDYADDIDQSGTVVVYPLNKSGEYILRRKDSGAEFPVYYARLSKADPRKNFTGISWTAVDTNNDNKGGVTNGTVTSNRISVSDFHEKLTLTIPLETVTTLKLSANSAYKFESGGDYIQNVTPTDGKATVTLVPVTAASNGELIDGTFTLSGSDANGNVYNAQEIEVYVRPYVIADGLYASDGTTSLSDMYRKDPANTSYVYVPKETEFKVKVTIPNDPNTSEKNVTLDFGWNTGGSYVNSTNANNNDATIESVQANASYEYTWTTQSVGDAILKMSGAETDVMRNNKFQQGQNFWPYLHITDDRYVRVGVGSYETAVKYANIKVTSADGTVTYIADGASNYTTKNGTWSSSDGTLAQTGTVAYTSCYAIHNVRIPADDYKLTCKATRTAGNEGFLFVFDYEGDSKYLQWNVGGWGNSVHTIESYGVDGGPGAGGSHNNSFMAPNSGGISGLIATNKEYNIEITVKDGIATCTCIPTNYGNYYLKYVYDIENKTRTAHWTSKMENKTYEYYNPNTTATGSMVEYVNGTEQNTDIIGITYGGWDRKYTDYSTEVTMYGGTKKTLNVAQHMGGTGQYVTLTIPYPMNLEYIWTPRQNHNERILYLIEGDSPSGTGVDNRTPTGETVSGIIYTSTNKLQPGTYTIASKNGETTLFYLKLSPQ